MFQYGKHFKVKSTGSQNDGHLEMTVAAGNKLKI